MTVLLVEHATEAPALDGMIAGLIAAERGGDLVHTVTGGAGLGRFDGVQHVVAAGALAPNGLLWFERASGRDVGEAVDRGAVAGLGAALVVVAINPLVAAHREAAERIEATALRFGRRVERMVVSETDGRFTMVGERSQTFVQDGYGRPVEASAAPVSKADATILMVADERLQREVYPANLAAIGDAADRLGITVAVRFADPRFVSPETLADAVRTADGVLLPGGSDMEQVAGQILAARIGLKQDRPTLGLCLGLQTMATAVAQEIAGLSGANLAEADPGAPIKTFVRLTDETGRPLFRVGLQEGRLTPGSDIARLWGNEPFKIRCNHRFVLNPALHEALFSAGLRAGALHQDRDLVDAIELPGHRFFMGAQGHPELTSAPDRPSPLITAFLAAAANRTFP